MSRVVVVGAGLSGLSAACHLVADGHDVTVLERDATPGGRNGVFRSEGFTFDTGPTVLTMPGLRWVICGANGIVSTAVSSPRPCPICRLKPSRS